MQSYDKLVEKWAPVLNENSAGAIDNHHKRAVTAAVLENQEIAMREDRAQQNGFLTEAAPGNATTSIGTWDPVLISLVRRSMPNLMAYDVAGVQPMSGPTGLIFAMKARFGAGAAGSTEALFAEANTEFSGSQKVNGFTQPADGSGLNDSTGAANGIDGERTTALMGLPMGTDSAEALGSTDNTAFAEMGFTIEKATVTAKSRALKAEYSLELAQDLKAIHGLDAETELANILSTEILAEMNREIIRLVNVNSVTSARGAAAGVFVLQTAADNGGGRWLVERVKGLVFAIEQEANEIAVSTRRGKGNFVIVSHGVAAALNTAGALDTGMGLSGPQNFDSDVTGSLFAGTLNGRMKVYIDPYAAVDYFTVGYKGVNPYDAGMFFCPYVPLSMMKTIGENDFQPRIGFKTRYGIADNPFVTAGNGNNVYYRKRKVTGL